MMNTEITSPTPDEEAQRLYSEWRSYPTMIERYASRMGYGDVAKNPVLFKQMAREGHTVEQVHESQA